ncbi:glutamine amidotransferase [Allomuricauda sp. SCSIO 65647]|uniref:glutamine amidotransferase n=1 Tax=Allomuricauda sp. SCSIO 65647 TaxID=2908843 RepID=UPI001F1AFD2C|nr:glutamine amidotransferase [Muricauda sp. SCSIO 65647]UJH67820.1 glutamine amidotransferase [Muricauda sp. SCSIO 65647]
MPKVLFIGESWFTYSVHQKGFDTFHTSEYVEGGTDFIRKITEMGMEVDYVPAHKIETEVPDTVAGYKKYDVVIISDVGANSFLLGRRTFAESIVVPNKLEAIKKYVGEGGSLLMVGGYMSFTGIDAKTRYGESPLRDCLPVKMLPNDDRVELPQGIVPEKVGDHDITKDLPKHWPNLLGYNKVIAKENTETLAIVGEDPLLVIGAYKKGKSAAFTSDLAPHWAPREFVDWVEYPNLWNKLIGWLTSKD